MSAFFLSFSLVHLSLFLFDLSIFCIFITFPLFFSLSFLHLRSFSPLLHLSLFLLSLFSRLSVHPWPCGPGEVAGWQKLDPLVSQVPYLTYEVLLCVSAERLCVCPSARPGRLSRGQSEVWEDDALDILWGEDEEVRERNRGRHFHREEWREVESKTAQWVRLLLGLN